MMKTALLASLATSASALTLSREDANNNALTMQKKAHELAEHLKHPLKYDTKLAEAVKKLSGQPLSSTLKAQALSKTRKSRRNLRGKKGKGKGKGKGKDDDDDEDSGEDSGDEGTAVARTNFQLQVGYCAGTTVVDTTLTEPHYMTSFQIWNDVCVNAVDFDDTPFSFEQVWGIDETGALTLTDNVYMLHDCVAENLQMSESVPTDEYTFGGVVSPNGMCTDIGGYGARIAFSETPVVHGSGGGVIVEGDDTSVNDCYRAMMNADYTSADLVEYTSNDIPTSSGYVTLCHTKDSGDDVYDDDSDDMVPDGGSYSIDLSRCNEDVQEFNIFSTPDCSGLPSSTIEEGGEMCLFDGREETDLIYLFRACWSGA